MRLRLCIPWIVVFLFSLGAGATHAQVGQGVPAGRAATGGNKLVTLTPNSTAGRIGYSPKRASTGGRPSVELRFPPSAAGAAPRVSLSRIPLFFEANEGQTAPAVKFLSRTSGATLFLTGSDAVLTLRGATEDGGRRKRSPQSRGTERTTLHHSTTNDPSDHTLPFRVPPYLLRGLRVFFVAFVFPRFRKQA